MTDPDPNRERLETGAVPSWEVPRCWYIEDYGRDLYGLKSHDTMGYRGIPEGPASLWMELADAMERGEYFHNQRLGWTPPNITSPRNSTEHCGFAVGDVGPMVQWIRSKFQPATEPPQETK